MNLLTLILFGSISGAVAWLAIPFIISRFAQSAAGRQQFHHTHRVPVPRWGGLALILGFWAVSALVFLMFPANPEQGRLRWTILTTATAMFALGFIDDLWPLGARRKLLGQILIAWGAWCGGVEVSKLTNIFTGQSLDAGLWSAPLTVLWLVALTNLINLIDGIDGLAGGISLMLMSLLAYAGWRSDFLYPVFCSVGLCGALIAFLRFNFPPARIYLGDGGAYFLGFLIGLLSIVTSHKGSITAALIAPAFALALPIIDVSIAILRRGLKGLPIFRPDKKHIHHRLQEIGFSRRRTVLFLYGLSLFFLVAAFAVFVLKQQWLPLIFGSMCLVLIFLARRFSFSREWLAVGRVVGNSLELRKETQYALLYTRVLEVEADRAETVDSLWSDFKFIVRKIGFSKVELHLDGSIYSWQTDSQSGESDEFRRIRHDLPQFEGMALEFSAHSEVMPPERFELMCELMAEAWAKSLTKWQKIHSLPITIKLPSSEPIVEAAAA